VKRQASGNWVAIVAVKILRCIGRGERVVPQAGSGKERSAIERRCRID